MLSTLYLKKNLERYTLKMSSISEKNSSYLTAEEREQYLSELTENQQAILQKYKRYKINSALFTQLNQKGAFWKIIRQDVYTLYDVHNPKKSPLICACGKHVKFLYTCESSSGSKKKFGRNHLEQEAQIPLNVIKQVTHINHQIDRGTDMIISKYHNGVRFPLSKYAFLKRKHLLSQLSPKKIELFEAFRVTNLPLYDHDKKILDSLFADEQDRITKERIRQEKLQQDKIQQRLRLKEEKEQQRKQENLKKKRNYFLNSLKTTFDEIFKGNEDLIEGYGLNRNDIVLQLVIYYMFNRGKCIHGSCITLPWQINEEVKMLIQGSYFIRDLIFKNDPHIILKLAIPQCTTKILKIFLTHQVIIPNKNGELIYK